MSKKRKIVVVGLGKFGRECALRLAEECEVLAIDISQKNINEIADDVQQARRIDVRDAEALGSVVTDEFDNAIISLGDRLEDSILAVLNLLNLGIKRIHTKTISKAHGEILSALAGRFENVLIETVNPDREAATRLAANIVNPNVLEHIALSANHFILEIATPDKLAGKTLGELQLRRDYNIYVIAVHEHVPENTIFMPGPNFVCKPSDSLMIIGQKEDLRKFRDLI